MGHRPRADILPDQSVHHAGPDAPSADWLLCLHLLLPARVASCRLPCELYWRDERFNGIVRDLNETGALIRVRKQLLQGDGPLLCIVKNRIGNRIAVEGRICRQFEVSSTAVEIGLKFINVDEKTADSLVVAAFGDSRTWNQPESEPGIFKSFWSLLRVFSRVGKLERKSNRMDLRMSYREHCLLVLADRTLEGTVAEISATGLSVNFSGTVDLVGENGTLNMKSVALKVRRIWTMQCEVGGKTFGGLALRRICPILKFLHRRAGSAT